MLYISPHRVAGSFGVESEEGDMVTERGSTRLVFRTNIYSGMHIHVEVYLSICVSIYVSISINQSINLYISVYQYIEVYIHIYAV